MEPPLRDRLRFATLKVFQTFNATNGPSAQGGPLFLWGVGTCLAAICSVLVEYRSFINSYSPDSGAQRPIAKSIEFFE